MIRQNEPLSRHTSFKIGGPAAFWAEAEDRRDILEAVSLADKLKKPFVVLGAGTNILARDGGFDGVVLRLGRGFNIIEVESDRALRVGAGVVTARLAAYASERGLSGCEFLAGLPGDFGGAIFMNAGVRDPIETGRFREIKDILLDAEVLDLKDNKVRTISAADIDFRYRSSNLDNKIILAARIGLAKTEKRDVVGRAALFMKKRDWLRKLGFPSAGSVFKNPDIGGGAGALIESCGLKGERAGGAEISRQHANVIVNVNKAKARDVLGLIELARRRVKEKFGVDLELELRII
ncbi:MAG: UDP-N-acetylmuramate dehydrogenase [Candidatus Omnitrophota bacterium]